MAIADKRISKETLDKISPLVPKLMNEVNADVFTKDELNLISIAYFEMTGKPTPKGCNGMCQSALKLVQNYFRAYPTTEITQEVVKPAEMDYYTFSLTELRGMFPSIKSTSKKDFIKQIESL